MSPASLHKGSFSGPTKRVLKKKRVFKNPLLVFKNPLFFKNQESPSDPSEADRTGPMVPPLKATGATTLQRLQLGPGFLGSGWGIYCSTAGDFNRVSGGFFGTFLVI